MLIALPGVPQDRRRHAPMNAMAGRDDDRMLVVVEATMAMEKAAGLSLANTLTDSRTSRTKHLALEVPPKSNSRTHPLSSCSWKPERPRSISGTRRRVFVSRGRETVLVLTLGYLRLHLLNVSSISQVDLHRTPGPGANGRQFLAERVATYHLHSALDLFAVSNARTPPAYAGPLATDRVPVGASNDQSPASSL
jgi:hypothetical protein